MAIHDGCLVIRAAAIAVARGNALLHAPNIRSYGACQETNLKMIFHVSKP